MGFAAGRDTGEGRRTDLAAPHGGQQTRRTNAPVEIHYVPVPKAKGAFVRKQETQDASYHAMAQSCIRIKNFGSALLSTRGCIR